MDEASSQIMPCLHCGTRILVAARIWTLNQMATLHYAEHIHIVQTQHFDSDPDLDSSSAL